MSRERVRYPIVTAEEFPHGLMCPTCRRPLQVGAPYATMLDGIQPEGDVVGTIAACVYCAVAGSLSATTLDEPASPLPDAKGQETT